MKKGGGKQKGNSFERKICKAISLFWSDGKHKDLCWRSASSGAVATVSRTTTKGYHGDLCAISPLIEPLFDIFSVELKHYKDLDITEVLRRRAFTEYHIGKGEKNKGKFLTHEPVKLLDFWKQTLISARKSDRIPILIAKRNHYPELLVCRMELLYLKRIMKKHLSYITLGKKLMVVNFFDFLENVDRDQFMEAVNTKWLENLKF